VSSTSDAKRKEVSQTDRPADKDEWNAEAHQE
jgi:hypothetical protein